MDSNDPLFIFKSFCQINNKIKEVNLLRENAPFGVGLNYSMMRSLGLFEKDMILPLTNLCSNLGITYGMLGPLLIGASSIHVEDLWQFEQPCHKLH